MTIRPDVPLDVVQVEHEPSQVVHFNISGPGASGGFRLYPDLNGPQTPASNTGGYLLGLTFTVTSPGIFFDGYWMWGCKSGQDTTGYNFALYHLTNTSTGTLLPAATILSQTIGLGQWTFIPSPSAVALTAGLAYTAVVGFSDSFPFTSGWWAPNLPGWNGITNGPLTAYSDASGSNPGPFSQLQCVFSLGTSDPTAGIPGSGSSAFNGWLDVQVGTS